MVAREAPLWLLTAAALLAGGGTAAAADCVSWDRPVELTGFLVDGVFPGPPEYESVADGDAALQARMLFLDEPVCVSGPNAEDAEPIDAIELVQITCEMADDRLGQAVSIAGTLFPAHTGYHRTRAVLDCGSKPAE